MRGSDGHLYVHVFKEVSCLWFHIYCVKEVLTINLLAFLHFHKSGNLLGSSFSEVFSYLYPKCFITFDIMKVNYQSAQTVRKNQDPITNVLIKNTAFLFIYRVTEFGKLTCL